MEVLVDLCTYKENVAVVCCENIGLVLLYCSGSQSIGRDTGCKGSKNGSRRGDLNLGCIFSPLPLLVFVCSVGA